MAERIWAGEVVGEGDEPLAVRAMLRLDGVATASREWTRALAIETSTGRVDLSLDPADIERVELTGSWSEVRAHRAAELFTEHAPGDHVEVEILVGAIYPGDVVAVAGSREGGGPVAVNAAAVGTDEAAARASLQLFVRRREHERRQPQAPRPKPRRRASSKPLGRVPWTGRTWGFSAIAAGLLAAGIASAESWRRLAPVGDTALLLWVGGLATICVALIGWSARLDRRVVFSLGRDPMPASRRFATALLQIFALPVALVSAYAGVRPGVAALAIVPAGLAIVWYRRAREQLRPLRLVAAAEPLGPEPASGDWGVASGVVKRGRLRGDTTRTAHSQTDSYTERTDDGGTRQVNRTSFWNELAVESSGDERLVVDSDAGELAIETKGAIVAAPGRWREARSKKGSPPAYRARSEIEPGDQVLVLGRLGGDGPPWSMEAAGRESLFVVKGAPRALALDILAPVIAAAVYTALVVATALV